MKDGNLSKNTVTITKNLVKPLSNINWTTMKKKPKKKRVLCCKCGTKMPPNTANMCLNCLPSEADITEGLQKRLVIFHCTECQSHSRTIGGTSKAKTESQDFLYLVIKRWKKLNSVKLVDAKFIWTEPHSIKLMLTVQNQVLNGMNLEQPYTVEYVVHDHICQSCSRIPVDPDQWVAVVQLRQHVSHRMMFFYLEQLILKHKAANHAIRIKQLDQGIDFFFALRSHALKFLDFVNEVAPIRSRNDEQLVHDTKSNNPNYNKYTFFVEIIPIYRGDLICLPPQVAASLGNTGPLVICTKVSNRIALLDPKTLRQSFLDADQYWKAPFNPLLSSRQLVEYVVLDINVASSIFNNGSSEYVLVDVHVARVSDFGKNSTTFFGSTHLGRRLKPGDHAFGYDLGSSINDTELEKCLEIPKVILIKKSYEKKLLQRRGAPRPWKLKSLNMEIDNSCNGRDLEQKLESEYELFLRDVEENPDLRSNLRLYCNSEIRQPETSIIDDEEGVHLDKLLADLDLK